MIYIFIYVMAAFIGGIATAVWLVISEYDENRHIKHC